MEEVDYMATSGNRGSHLASRSVLTDFTGDVLTTSAGILFQNGIARMPNVYWRTSLLVELIGVGA